MTVELLTEHCLEFLSLTGGCTGSFESTLVKISNCWKSRAAAHLLLFYNLGYYCLVHQPRKTKKLIGILLGSTSC